MSKNKSDSIVTHRTVVRFFALFIYLLLVVFITILMRDSALEAGFSRTLITIFEVVIIAVSSVIFYVTFYTIIVRKSKGSVEDIIQATKKMKNGDYSVRLKLSDEDDELDEIKENLNLLCDEITKTEIFHNDFIANVSHEIKTPIAKVMNYSMSLKDDLDDETRDEYIDIIVATLKNLSSLIGNILKLNKLENSDIVPEKKTENVLAIVEEILATFYESMEKKKIELIADLDDVSAVTDASLVSLICSNLVSNAVKFTDNGEIKVSLKKQGNGFIFKITDTGIGMDSEQGNRIFDKFYQGDTSHASEGNGLGLSLVKRAAYLLGAKISVESQLSRGTTFTVEFK